MVGGSLRPGTLASSTTETGRHDIAEILLKVTLSTKNQNQSKTVVHLNNKNVDIKFSAHDALLE
jgi:hypothetical protein